MDITADLLAIMQTHSNSDETVQLSSNIIQDLGLDSIQVMELVFDIESKFDISISLNQLPEINSVGDLQDHITKQLQSKA
jgi:acyl carrier protein